MFERSLRWLVLVIVFIGASSAVAQTKMRAVTIDGDRVLLGDVVRNAPRQIASLDMGPAPRPGHDKIISGKQIRSRLKKAMITQRGLKIAKKLRVRRGVQNVDELKLRRLMRAALSRQLAPGIRFDDMILRGGVAMPRGRLRVELEMPRKVRMGLNNFKANIYAGNSKPKTTIVRVELRSDAAMARHMIARGDPVWLRVKAGAVVVSTRGVAQQDGRTGQRIAVMPRQGRKVVYGTVTESGVVEMEL